MKTKALRLTLVLVIILISVWNSSAIDLCKDYARTIASNDITPITTPFIDKPHVLPQLTLDFGMIAADQSLLVTSASEWGVANPTILLCIFGIVSILTQQMKGKEVLFD